MLKIGLTGAIGSGKSTLARAAGSKLGIPVFDADAAVHELYAEDEELKAFIARQYGAGIIVQGTIDRKALSAFIKDADKRHIWKQVEGEIHRRVLGRLEAFFAGHEAKGVEMAIGDVPYLFETACDGYFDYTINISAPYEVQKSRAMGRAEPKLTEEEFDRRYKTFMPEEKRNRRADFVVDNHGSAEAGELLLRARLQEIRRLQNSCRNSFNEAAVYVGSFDPFTLGHLDVVQSAVKMPYPKLYIAIGVNPSKQPMFSVTERKDMIEAEMNAHIRPNLPEGREIIVTEYSGLTVDFMRSVKASMCIRGLRGVKDLMEEESLAAVNADLYADTITEEGAGNFTQVFFATANPELRHVSSSYARSICQLGRERDVSLLRCVSPEIAVRMIAKRDAALTCDQ